MDLEVYSLRVRLVRGVTTAAGLAGRAELCGLQVRPAGGQPDQPDQWHR